MKLQSKTNHIRAALTAAALLTAPAGAQVFPGGNFADSITVVAGFAGESVDPATAEGALGPDLIHIFDTEVGTTDPTYELTVGGAIALSSGRHLVLYNAEFEGDTPTAGTNRAELNSKLKLAGTDLAIGRSQAFIRDSGNVAQDCITTGGAIITVANDDDVLELVSFRSDDNAGQSVARRDGFSAMQVMRIDDSWDLLSLERTTNQSPNITTTAANVVYDLVGENSGTAFTYVSGDPSITINESGLYLVFANTGINKTNNNTRTEFRQHLALDGSMVSGTQVTTYLRGNQNGEDANSGMASNASILNVTAGQQLSVSMVKVTGTDGTIQGGTTALTIAKLPPTAKYISLLDTSEQPINDASADPVLFATQVSPSNSEFGFTPGGSAVTVNTDSDYLFLGSLYTLDDSTADNADRAVVRTGWQIDGAGGALAYGQGAEYMRDSGGAHEAGNWCGAILDLTATQTVELMTQGMGNTDPAEGDEMGLLALSIESLKASPNPAISVNNTLETNPNVTSTIDGSLLSTFDADTPAASLTYTVDTVPAGGTLQHTVNGVLGMGGTFTQDDIDNNRIEYVAGMVPFVGVAFDFTVSDGTASDASSFLVDIAWPESIVTITADGDVTEGGTAGWTLNATLAPSDTPLTVNIVYTGSAADGSDYTAVASVDIPVGLTTADLDVVTMVDGVFEGCEFIVAGIGVMSGGNLTPVVGDPGSDIVALNEGNSAPGGNLTAVVIGVGVVDMDVLSVFDPDADYSSLVSTAGAPVYQFGGQGNLSVFSDGRSDDDYAFDIDGTGPALSEAAGMSVDLEFVAQEADLTGTVLLWEIGGTSNGSSIRMVDGIPHLVSKAAGATADGAVDGDGNPANGIEDLDWAGNVIAVPLSATPVVPGTPTRLAVIYAIAADTVTYSMNGAAAVTKTLANNDSTNWIGDHSVAHGERSGGIGGSSATAGNVFHDSDKSLAGGIAAVSCARFWNEAGGTISATPGLAESVTLTLTIDGWVSGAGDITALSGNGETYLDGVWTITGDAATVNAALGNAIFIPGAGTPDPTVILVSLEDGDEDGGGPSLGSVVISATAPGTVYVDDSFAGGPGTVIVDADNGTPVASATLAYDAFTNLTEAVAAVDPAGTIVVNGGDYSGEDLALTGTMALRLTDATEAVAIGSLDAPAINAIDIQNSALTAGATGVNTIIDCPIEGTTGTLTKTGIGDIRLRGASTFTGVTTINDGRIVITYVDAVTRGSLASTAIVVDNPGILALGAAVDTVYTHSIPISGTGDVSTFEDGTVVFASPGPNTFSGEFNLGDGASSTWDGVDLGNKQGFVVVNDSGHLGTGKVLSRGGQLQAGVPGIVIANDIDITGGGFRIGGTNDFEFSGQVNPIDAANRGYGNYGLEGLDLTISGNINLDDGNMNIEGSNNRDNGTWTITGDISGLGNLLFQNGFDNGVATFSGTHTYQGTTTLEGTVGGVMILNGTHTGGAAYTVNNGTALSGNGSTDAAVTLNAGGILSPGIDGVGTIGTGDLTLAGTLEIDVENTAGTGHDQVIVTGLVDLTGGLLVVNEGTTVELAPAEVVIIANDDVDALSGLLSSPVQFSSDYLGSGLLGKVDDFGSGDGNDVTLLTDGLSIIGAWRDTNFGSSANLGAGANDADSGDGDGLINLLEFGFGTDPNAYSLSPVDVAGSAAGQPIVDGAGAPNLVWVQHLDAGDLGSVSYTPQFSSDLQVFTDDLTVPTVVGTIGADYEIVSLPFPPGTQFGRVVVEAVE